MYIEELRKSKDRPQVAFQEFALSTGGKKAIEIDKATLSQKIELFKSVEQHKVFRGKYEIEFLLKLIREILSDSHKTKIVIKEKNTNLPLSIEPLAQKTTLRRREDLFSQQLIFNFHLYLSI
jgi:hypothetical protein